MVPPTDVDMAPDDSFTSPLAADLAMEEDTLDLDAPVEYDTFDAEEEGSMAVSEDEQDELIMEDPEEVSAEVEEDVVGEGETDMLLEPSDTVDHATSAVEDGVSLEVKGVVEPEAEAKAIVDVDISGLPSPAPVVAPSPQPDLDDQPDDPADATDLSSATDNILQVEVAVSPKPESFVLVESPSDAEDNGEPAVAEEADEDDPAFNHAEPEESAVVLEETVTEEQDKDEVQLEIQDLEDFDGAIDSSSTSSQANVHDDTAFFSVASDSGLPMPITISFQRIGLEVDSDALETITYSLFVPSDLPSTSTTPLPKVILGSQSNLYEAALSDLFDALRQEAEFSDEAGVLAIDDEDGTREWVLEHRTEAICLAVGEDNISARDTTLADLAHVHRLCDLPEPMELRLRAGEVRFKQRIEMIAQMRDMMDDEESGVDVDELEEEEEEDLLDAEERHAGVDHEDHEDHDVHGEDAEEGHDEIIDDGEEGGESEEVTGRPDFEQGEHEEDELDEDVPEPEESDQLGDVPDDQTVEDQPNNTDDPEFSEQVNDGPSADVENEAGTAENTTNFSIDATEDSNPSGIATDSKIVQTANGDLEVPAVAQHAETQLGSFDEKESVRQVGPEDSVDETVVDGAPLDDQVENDEAANLAQAAVEEASADSTVEAAVETVPIPAQFTQDDAAFDDVLIMEENGDAVDAGAQSDVSSSTQAVKRKRHGSDSSEAPRSTRSAKLVKPQAVVAAERDIYDDSPLPTAAPELVQDLHADSIETGDDSGSAESELIIVEEGDKGPDEIGAEDEEDRVAKRLRAD